MEISTIVAIVSLLVAVTTLFLTHLQPPKLTSQSGPFIKVYYADYETGGSFGLYLPVTFINKSARTGTILNAAIALRRRELPEQTYFIQWREFSKLDVEQNKWIFDEMAHALAIPGKSAITKVIWFMWNSDSQPKLILREGSYILDFYFWDRKGTPPSYETHEFLVNSSVFNKLESYRLEKNAAAVDIRLDEEIDQNRLMTSHEAKRLLA